MKLIIGLGNPGEKFKKVRHNLGFMAVDEYAKEHLGPKIEWEVQTKFKSEIIKISPEVILIKPQTFMNNSGIAVKLTSKYYKVTGEDLIIVYDELDLPLGKIKVRLGGAAAGHHGVESIIEHLGTDQFVRVRLGIGTIKTQGGEHKNSRPDTSKFVLKNFVSSEQSSLKHLLKQSVGALELLLNSGLQKAQNQYN